MDLSEDSVTLHPLFGELPLYRAAVWAEDAGQSYIDTMGDVLGRWPQITVDDYWHLTVKEHAALIAQLHETLHQTPRLLARALATEPEAQDDGTQP